VLKPSGSQNVLAQTTGVVNLPVTKWSMGLMVNADDLKNEKSELRQIEKAHPGVYIFSEEEFAFKKSGVGVYINPANPDGPDLSSVRKNRKELLEQINYRPPAPGLSRIVVAVGENGGSIDHSHPDFRDGGEGSVWLKPDDQSGFAPPVKMASGGTVEPPSIRNMTKDDHGTHVAGLLAARGDVAPGLLPTVGLFLIDLDSPAGLVRNIEDARNRGIYIFNFSFAYPADNSPGQLKDQMKRFWWDMLFVVAAGNEGKNLRKDPRDVPIGWANEIKSNIIGVGAAGQGSDLLGSWIPDPTKPDKVSPGSNYSKEYIHVIAPGREIFSQVKGNAYAPATGTSQAVPLVTAAAATLWAQDITNPAMVKARIIYTADWFSPQMDDKVWGGSLNFGRAVWEPRRNLLVTQSQTEKVYSIEFIGNSKIQLRGGEMDDPQSEPSAHPKKGPSQIPLGDILRIRQIGNHFRIIYRDSDRVLRIVNNVEAIEGKILCHKVEEWDPNAGGFKESNNCSQGIQASQIFDYTARIPPSIVF
jgi:hypothetical protein